MSKRRLLAVAIGTAAVLVGAGCAKQTGTSTGSTEIPIGVDIEKSGPSAVQGQAYERALKLIASQVNKKGITVGGRTEKIKLIIRDNKSDPAESLQVAKSLIDNDKVAAIIGGGASPTTMSIVDTVEARKVPLISMGSSDAIVNPIAQRHYIFKTPANTSVAVSAIADQFPKQGIKKIALLSVDNAYGAAGLKAWQDLANQGKVELVDSEKFGPSDKDFTVQVTKMIGKQPDAIIVWAVPPAAGIAAQNIRQASFPANHVFFDTAASAELFVKGAGKAAEGMYMVHSRVLAGDQIMATSPGAQAQKNFFTDYSRTYGEFSGFAPFAADALTAIVDAVQKSQKTDRQGIRDALEHLSFDGATGAYQFSTTNHGGVGKDALTLLVVKNGTWTLTS